MRLSALLLACVSTSSLAYQFPTPEDPRARAVFERTGMDTARLDALLAFPKPAPQAWPCEAPIAYLYQPGNLVDALQPEQIPADLKAQMEEGKRLMRKTFRGNGMDPSAAPVTTSSDIELIPIKAQCKNGKLDGPVEYFLGFKQVMESNIETFSTLTNKLEKTRSVLTTLAQMHVTQSYQDGKPVPGIRSVRRGTITNRSTYENPAIQKAIDDSLSKTGSLNRASPMKSVIFGDNAAVASFSLTEEPKVTGGVFGINTEWKIKLHSMIMLITPPVNVSYMYADDQPLSVMRQNKETGNSESTTYMENYLKKLGKKPGDTPGTENYRAMVLGGRDVLEMRHCVVDFKPAKMDPCPVE